MTKHAHTHILKKHKHKKHRHFERAIYIFAFTTPLFELPQLISIVAAQSAENVSLITWAYLAISSFAWLAYGIVTKTKPLIISYSLYTVVEFSLVASIIWFS